MIQRLRARLTYANVMATIAVFIALGGSSYAAIEPGRTRAYPSGPEGGDTTSSVPSAIPVGSRVAHVTAP
jgi:hypothetical protein